MNTIIFQYFDGCPHSSETLENLKSLLDADSFKDFELQMVEVPNPDMARELNFQGSPTVLINGVDIYTEEIPTSYNYSCRIFTINGVQTGVLSEEYLHDKLSKLGVS